MYLIADNRIIIDGKRLMKAMEMLPGFNHFRIPESELGEISGIGYKIDSPVCSEAETKTEAVDRSIGVDAPAVDRDYRRNADSFLMIHYGKSLKVVPFNVLYSIETETGLLELGIRTNSIIGRFTLKAAKGLILLNKSDSGQKDFSLRVIGSVDSASLSFALWVTYNLAALASECVAVHSSAIVYDNQAVLFLGESGTGKSTHTRLWQKHITGSELLNDDSPIVRVTEGKKIMAYGSPWSGKSPCYKQESYPIKAFVRITQSPNNNVRKLQVLDSIGALLPSCPPFLSRIPCLTECIYTFLSDVLSSVPVYHLECRPDEDAARLSYTTVFGKQ